MIHSLGNPYQSPKTKSTTASTRSKRKWWIPFVIPIIPIVFFLIHAIAVLCFAMIYGPYTGPGAGDGWSWATIFWFYVDFPIGFFAIDVADTATTNVGALSYLIVIGGFQWAFWGLLLLMFISFVRRFMG